MLGALIIKTLDTTIYTVGIPPEITLLFKAVVVVVLCLLQSPAFRAKVSSAAGRPPARPGRRRHEQPGDAGMTSTAGTTAGSRKRVRRPQQQHIPVLATAGAAARPDVRRRRRAATTGFSDTQVVLNVFIDNAFLLVVAVGMTFVILTGGIDLSVGAVVALTTMIVAPRC